MADDQKTTLQDARTAAQESREEFREAHQRGMTDLKEHDFEGLGQAIADEQAAIEKLARAVDTTLKVPEQDE